MGNSADKPTYNLPKLRKLFAERVTLEEMFLICFDLQIEYESVVGKDATKPFAAAKIIDYLNKRDRLAELVTRLRKEFPSVDWTEIEENKMRPNSLEAHLALLASLPYRPGVRSNPWILDRPFKLEMMRVDAGEFLMGSDKSKYKAAQKDELPQHEVTLPEFYVGKYPITNEQYAVFANAKQVRFSIQKGKEQHPVVNVSWHDAKAFCEWLRERTGKLFRLPTEAEWEKAARGAEGWIYPWGSIFDAKRLSSWESGLRDTTPVGKHSPEGDSPYSLTDVAGNVREWTTSPWKRYPYSAGDGREALTTDGNRVMRGGSFHDNQVYTRCAHRYKHSQGSSREHFGFRVVVSPISLPLLSDAPYAGALDSGTLGREFGDRASRHQ